MAIYYVANKHPRSYNKRGQKSEYKQWYENDFNQNFANLYNNIPIKDKTLYSSLTLLHRLDPTQTPDVDNLSKPIVDAFCGVIYEDDRQVISRNANIIQLKDYDINKFNATDLPFEIFNEFNTLYKQNPECLLFFAVKEYDVSSIEVGAI